jgi:ATP-dependent RNA helicase SUPV3L1/SUV3
MSRALSACRCGSWRAKSMRASARRSASTMWRSSPARRRSRRPCARYFGLHGRGHAARDRASFVAIDEVQLAGDLERGHIFTDRVLHLRGRHETLLLGAATMRGILEQLLPGIHVVDAAAPVAARLCRLEEDHPPAAALRHRRVLRRRGLCDRRTDPPPARRRAVVLGALSPRTRNAQVELYQAGDVEYLVATDAIGMGLNLDVDHVAFAQNRKFDGYQYRNLNPPPSSARSPAAPAAICATALSASPARSIRSTTNWSNASRRTSSTRQSAAMAHRTRFDLQPRGLKRVARHAAAVEGLTRALPAVDQQALEHLSRYPRSATSRRRRSASQKLWEACALPDYRRITPAQHADLIDDLCGPRAQRGHVDEDYMADQVRRADRPTAKSTRFRSESRRSGRGPSCRTGPDGLPIRHTGRKRRGKSKTDCPMRYMNG